MTETAYGYRESVCPLMAFVKDNTPPRVDIQRFDDSFAEDVFSSAFQIPSDTKQRSKVSLMDRLAAAKHLSLNKELPPTPPVSRTDYNSLPAPPTEYDPYKHDEHTYEAPAAYMAPIEQHEIPTVHEAFTTEKVFSSYDPYTQNEVLTTSETSPTHRACASFDDPSQHEIATSAEAKTAYKASDTREALVSGVPPSDAPVAKTFSLAVSTSDTAAVPIQQVEEAGPRPPSPLPSLSNLPALSTSMSTAPSTAGSASETSQDYFSPQLFESQTSIGITSPTAIPRKRGFMRPQATSFAASARNRDSVMDLGSISHLQYYFARTGLLDGRGGQLARDRKARGNMTLDLPATSQTTSRSVSSGSYDSQTPDGLLSVTSPTYAISDMDLAETPSENDDGSYCVWSQDGEAQELPLLPPTMSTCKQRTPAVVPPPDITKLRRVLTEALEDALKVLTEAENCTEDTPGFHELRGLHLLDIITLAIRAAKAYYTSHPRPSMLYAQKPDRQLRAELFDVLELLQRIGARNFAGGIRPNEKVGLLTWIVGISELIQGEIEAEKIEQKKRQEWAWRGSDDAWAGREREREWLFLNSFADEADKLPRWDDEQAQNRSKTHDISNAEANVDIASLPSGSAGFDAILSTPQPFLNATDMTNKPTSTPNPSPFLQTLSTGLLLVKLHNKLVALSSRPFEAITTFHTDTAKPYRCAENLRYWLKAAERRWDLRLDLDVAALVRVRDSNKAVGTEDDVKVWRQFDAAVLKWCSAVRGELEREWDEAAAVEEANARKREREGEGIVAVC